MTAIWSRDAQNDLIEAETFLSPRDDHAAKKLVRDAVAATAFLAEHPQAGPLVPGRRLRKWRVPRSHYLLLYRVTGGNVRIVRLMHDARNWMKFV